MFEFVEEEGIEISLSVSKKNDIVKILKQKDLLNYGIIITESMIEEILDKKKKHLSQEKWQFLLLQFREIIKNEGFFITGRGRNGDLYILQPQEMPIYNDKKTKVMFKNLKQRQRSLNMIDPYLLSKEAAKKLEFEILKNARIEIELARANKERCR